MSNQENVNRVVRLIAEQGFDRASQSLSKLLKTGAGIELKKVEMVDISLISEQLTTENQEVIGSFVGIEGKAPLKFLFYVQTKGAYWLTDLLMNNAPGTTGEFNEYVSSTVQEIANILASAIANTFTNDFQISFKPTPPMVFNDFSAALFQELICETAAEDNKVLLLESRFVVMKVHLPCCIFVIPMPGSYKILSEIL